MVVRVQSMDPELNLSELSVRRAEQTPSSDKFVRAQRLPNQTNAEPGQICPGSAFAEPSKRRMGPDSGSMANRDPSTDNHGSRFGIHGRPSQTTATAEDRGPWRTSVPAAANAAPGLVLPAKPSRWRVGCSTRLFHTSGKFPRTDPSRGRKHGHGLAFS